MPPLLAVQHPDDPTLASFDWWAWRLQRRFLIDRLLALAGVEGDPTTRRTLRHLGAAFASEQYGEEEHILLHDYLGLPRTFGVTLQRDLLLVLAERTRHREAPLQMHWRLPVIRPDWSRLAVTRADFVGTVDAVPMAARLIPSDQPIPAYQVVWQTLDGQDRTAPMGPRDAGPDAALVPAVWDWLLARRLTVLSAAGLIAVPSAAHPPLRLGADWTPLPRVF